MKTYTLPSACGAIILISLAIFGFSNVQAATILPGTNLIPTISNYVPRFGTILNVNSSEPVILGTGVTIQSVGIAFSGIEPSVTSITAILAGSLSTHTYTKDLTSGYFLSTTAVSVWQAQLGGQLGLSIAPAPLASGAEGTQMANSLVVNAIPEPSGVFLVVIGSFALLYLRKR
jgi:hypothetical protein